MQKNGITANGVFRDKKNHAKKKQKKSKKKIQKKNFKCVGVKISKL